MALIASVFTPYSAFAVRIIGTAVALVLFARIAARVGPSTAQMASVAGGVLMIIFVSQIWDGAARLDTLRTSLDAPPGTDSFNRCFVDGGHPDQLPFVLWLAQHVPQNAGIHVQDKPVDVPCTALTLRGRRLVPSAAQADWLVWVTKVPRRLVRQAMKEADLPPQQQTVFIFAGRQVAVRVT